MKKSLGAQTIAYPTPIWVIGSYDNTGKPDAATAAWVGISCSRPAAVSVSFQKVRASYENIINRKAFTVNIPSERYLKETDYFGIVSGKKVDKFAATGLTPVKSDLVDAPYIAEFPMILECRVIHQIEIGLHTEFIGEILDVKVDDTVLGEKDIPLMEKVLPILFAPGAGRYYGIGKEMGKAFSIGKEIGG